MEFIKQRISLPIKNIECELNKRNDKRNRHSPLLPNNIRCIISGPSNCGKTNVNGIENKSKKKVLSSILSFTGYVVIVRIGEWFAFRECLCVFEIPSSTQIRLLTRTIEQY